MSKPQTKGSVTLNSKSTFPISDKPPVMDLKKLKVAYPKISFSLSASEVPLVRVIPQVSADSLLQSLKRVLSCDTPYAH